MILRRYITWQVFISTVLVLGFLVVMLLGGRLIRYFGLAAEGGLQVGVLFRLIGYNLPYFLELVLPLSFFIALMLSFGRLYADSEMVVMNSSGISRSQLGRLLAPLVILLMFIEAYLSFVGKPWGVRQADLIWQDQALVELFDVIHPKNFISHGDYHLYVGEIGENRSYLSDVILIQSAIKPNDNFIKDWQHMPKDVMIIAKKATQVPSSGGAIVLDLHQGRRYEFNPASVAYNEVGFERYRVSFENAPQEIDAQRIESIATTELIRQIRYHTSQAFPISTTWAELGYRMSLPWLIVFAVMIALPLSQVNPRQGRWGRLVPAILVFVVVVLIIISFKNAIEKQKLEPWAYPVILLVIFLFALYLNYHGRLLNRYRLNKTTTNTQGQL